MAMTRSDLKTSTKLSLAAGITVALVLGMGLTGFMYLDKAAKGTTHIARNNYGRLKVFKDIKESLNTADAAMLGLALTKDDSLKQAEKGRIDRALAAYGAGMKSLDGILKHVLDLKVKKQLSGIMEELKGSADARKAADARFLELVSEGKTEEASALWSGEIAKISTAQDSLLADTIRISEERAEFRVNELIGDTVKGKETFLGIAMAVMLLIVSSTWLVVRSTSRSLSKGISVAGRLSQGDLTVEIDTERKDETGRLLLALSSMAQEWRHILREVSASSDNIASSTHQLNASAEEMLHGSKQQAMRAGQAAAAAEQMSRTIMDVARNSSDIASSGIETAKIARSGKEIVDQAVREVHETSDAVETSASMVKSLGDKCRQIGNIIDVINDIADQTNLLALNAAIEAARAGEQGRGFAVVADEVRKLAEKAGSSTSKITGMIGGIQEEVERTAAFIEGAKSKAVSGAVLSQRAGDALSRIVEETDRLESMVAQIASSTEEMAGTSESISRDIEEIATLSGETSSGSNQVFLASDDLSKLAVSLQGAIRTFKV